MEYRYKCSNDKKERKIVKQNPSVLKSNISKNNTNEKPKYNMRGGMCFLGMGDCGSTTISSTSINNNQLIINKDTLHAMAEDVNKTMSDVVNRSIKSCSQSASNTESSTIHLGDIGGNFTTGPIELDMVSKIDFKCLQDSNIQTQIVQETAQKIMDGLKSSMKSDAYSTLAAQATASTKNGFLSLPTADKTEGITKIVNNMKQINETDRDLTNIIVNETTNKFTNENIQKCMQQISNSQTSNITAGNIAGNATVGPIKLSQSTDSVLSCVQVEKNITDVLKTSMSNIGLTVDDSKSGSSTTNVTAASTASTEHGGIGDLFNIYTLISVVVSAVVLIIVAIIGVVAFKMFSSNQQSNMAGLQSIAGSMTQGDDE